MQYNIFHLSVPSDILFSTKVSFLDQLFYSSTSYQTDFRNDYDTKYNCRTQYLDYHVTLNTFLSQNMKKYFFRETMKW